MVYVLHEISEQLVPWVVYEAMSELFAVSVLPLLDQIGYLGPADERESRAWWPSCN